MLPKIGVAIGTYGDLSKWSPLAERALRSVTSQSVVPLFKWCHRESLERARNEAAYTLVDQGCDWLIFLDGDDELHREYVRNMALSASYALQDAYPIFQPSTLGIQNGIPDNEPYLMPQEAPLLIKNYLILGCMHRASLFKQLKGFDDYPLLEDWDYWLRAEEQGATVHPVPHAVYKVHIDNERTSRNKSQSEVDTENLIQSIRNKAKARRRVPA